MKKIFFWLLNKYSKTESQRLDIHKVLHEKVSLTYSEQTGYGNLLNGAIEFLIASPIAKDMEEIHIDSILSSGSKEFKQQQKKGLLP